MLELHAGKRYWFPLNNYTDRKKSGLFTGEFDKNNGNAILMAKKRRYVEYSSLRPLSQRKRCKTSGLL